MKRRLLIWLLTALALYVALCALLWLFQARLIFLPGGGNWDDSPADAGLSFRELRLPVERGETIHAWHVPHPNARATVLFCHGNAGTLRGRIGLVEAMHRLGFASLFFDYRGYGKSDGSPSERNTYADCDAAWRWLTTEGNVPPERIVLWGRSLGGAVAVECASRRRVAALVVESSFSSLVDAAAHHYPWAPVRLLLRHRFDAAARVGSIDAPKLFAIFDDDRVVPPRFGRRLFDAAAEPKTLLALPGDHDSALVYTVDARARLDRFLNAALTAPAK